MDTSTLKTFAQSARRQLMEQVATRLEQVLSADSIETREKKAAISELRQQIAQSSKAAVIDRVAYTWFNRFCALRFMDVNHYTKIGIVSPVAGFTQPEILQEAKQGVIDPEFRLDRQRILDILSGKIPSSDPQGEAYRLLLVGACNTYHQMMPFLFQPIADYTELLMPDDLLSEQSVLHAARQALTEDACQDVEVIGWLYQFYISERKDEVFANLKQNIKIEARDIPAATQLFTPHWIVRYLVENSLGRLWMLNHPGSKLVEQMDYYIKPEQAEGDYLRIESPEEIKVCDPACGSGHMLTYAFDLLYAIYAEQGYDPAQIPGLILKNNLYGIEIDERAGDLAAFALVMRARSKDRRFFSRKVEPNICVLQNVSFTDREIEEYKNIVGSDLFTEDLWISLKQFEQAENLGSLMQPKLKDVSYVLSRLEKMNIFENLFLHTTNEKVQLVLKQAEYLAPLYHIVVTNPPYMGTRNMNSEVKEFINAHYPNSKSDLFAVFIDRGLELARRHGYLAMITMQSWMFLSSYEKLRVKLLSQECILTMAHLGARAFDTIGGEVVSTTAFVLQHSGHLTYQGIYLRLIDGGSETEKQILLRANRPVASKPLPDLCFIASATDFKTLPGAPIAYWVSEKLRKAFEYPPLRTIAVPRQGFATGKNEIFLRYWFEVDIKNIGFNQQSRSTAKASRKKWFPCTKGGSFRKWYGNNHYVANWFDDGKEMKNFPGSVIRNPNYYFKEGITWSTISNKLSMRYLPKGFLFETKGSVCFSQNKESLYYVLGFTNSKLAEELLHTTSPTLDFHEGPIGSLPLKISNAEFIVDIVKNLIAISKHDWDSNEMSWDFAKHQLFSEEYRYSKIEEGYQDLKSLWKDSIFTTRKLEIELNQTFLDCYNLSDTFSPVVDLEWVSLSCNPEFRYSSKNDKDQNDSLLLMDTIKEFISYAVGCMFGRFSLDKPGLILANQGETTADYLAQIPDPSFPPDEDNVIPILDEGWFNDDITGRFKQFLRVTFGDEHFDENLAFIENALGKDVRSYFLKDFYGEHLKMYKNRPIYWLFSSPKGSFNALIYMHRYRPDTVSVLLNNYLREYVRKLNARKAHMEQLSLRMGGSQAEKTRAIQEINNLNKVLAELKDYEDDVLYPLAMRQIQIDLDDGVKVNYKKFGKALKPVKGLSE